jgi:PAS domain S-box-containing protein
VGTVPIELVLVRQAAEYLTQAIFLVDEGGTVLFFNEAAAALLGRPFEDVAPQNIAEWLDQLEICDGDGRPVPGSAVPIAQARRDRRPAHAVFDVRGLDGVVRRLAVTSVPLIGQGGVLHGAMSLMWDAGGDDGR